MCGKRTDANIQPAYSTKSLSFGKDATDLGKTVVKRAGVVKIFQERKNSVLSADLSGW